VTLESFDKALFPPGLLEEYEPVRAYVGKLGFKRLLLPTGALLRMREPNGADLVETFVASLYDRFNKSGYVTEVVPAREQHGDVDNGYLMNDWLDERQLRLTRGITARIELPPKKREALSLFPWSWRPEVFRLYFDGAQFFAYAPTPTVPVSTDLGQIARDLLDEMLTGSSVWGVDHNAGIGPTPIHPEIYIVAMRPRNALPKKTPERLPHVVVTPADDLLICASGEDPLSDVLPKIYSDMNRGLSQFYTQAITSAHLQSTIWQLDALNELLANSVSEYFDSSFVTRLLSPRSRDIRRTLSRMHSTLHSISSLEIRCEKERKEASQTIDYTEFLHAIGPYFARHMTLERTFDKEAQLGVMNFAADETSNYAVVRATFIAAVAGAVLGALLTILGQHALQSAADASRVEERFWAVALQPER
jgi:hypothetical protein